MKRAKAKAAKRTARTAPTTPDAFARARSLGSLGWISGSTAKQGTTHRWRFSARSHMSGAERMEVVRGAPVTSTHWMRPNNTPPHSPNSLLLGVLNALKNGRLGAGWSCRVPSRLVSHFLCLPVLFSRGSRLACLPLPFICLPILFICLPGHFLSFVSHFFSLSPRLGACGRVPGRLVSHFLSFVSHFFSFVSQAGCLWLAGLSPTSFHLPPRLGRLGACGRVHFLSFVSQARCLWSGSRPACLPLPFICLPLLFCLWSGSRPACLPLPLICLPLLFHLSPTSFHLSPRLGACGRVPGPLVSHLLSFVSRFFSFISQKCFICLPGPSCHVAFLFICLCHC